MLATAFVVGAEPLAAKTPTAAEVLAGLREFYRRTARPDGSFQPGIDPNFLGMSDSAYSDLAPVAVTIHKTFGWAAARAKTAEFLVSRQKPNGDFQRRQLFIRVRPAEAYNTTQGWWPSMHSASNPDSIRCRLLKS